MNTFKKKRNGRTLEFNKQIQLWRKHRKSKGALAGSINSRVGKEKTNLLAKQAKAAAHEAIQEAPTEEAFVVLAKNMFD
jgi:hypothetical protein